MSDFYERYERLRRSKRMTDTEVAKATGISRSSFTDWKTGRRETPSTTALLKLARYFKVPISYFTTHGEHIDNTEDIVELADLITQMRNNSQLQNLVRDLFELDDDDLFVIEVLINAFKERRDVASDT